MTFITGSFSATYHGRSLGALEDGFEQIVTPIYEMIQVDHYAGDIDGVFRGMNMSLRAILTEVDMPAVYDLIWPWDGNANGVFGDDINSADSGTDDGLTELILDYGAVGPSGVLLSRLAKPLILTPCPGTSARTNGRLLDEAPYFQELNAITFPRVIISAEPQVLKYAGSHRKIPVTLIVLPTEVASEQEVEDNLPSVTFLCGARRYFQVS